MNALIIILITGAAVFGLGRAIWFTAPKFGDWLDRVSNEKPAAPPAHSPPDRQTDTRPDDDELF